MHNFWDILQYVSGFERRELKRHFGSDQSVWRDGDWNGFVRIALAGLLASLIELAQSVGHLVPNCRAKVGDKLLYVS